MPVPLLENVTVNVNLLGSWLQALENSKKASWMLASFDLLALACALNAFSPALNDFSA